MMPKTAVLIDGENVGPAVLAALPAFLQEQPDVRRVYGDWARSDLGPWRAAAEAAGYRLVQVTRLIQGKSSVDQGITIDAMDLLHSRRFDTLCLVTNDTDFVPLLTRLREEQVRTVLIGDRRAPEGLRSAAHVFHELPAPAVAPTEGPGSKGTPQEALPLLLEAYAATERDGKANLAALGAAVKKLQPGFAAKDYGRSRLLDLLEELPDAFQILQEPKGDDPPIHYVSRRKPANGRP